MQNKRKSFRNRSFILEPAMHVEESVVFTNAKNNADAHFGLNVCTIHDLGLEQAYHWSAQHRHRCTFFSFDMFKDPDRLHECLVWRNLEIKRIWISSEFSFEAIGWKSSGMKFPRPQILQREFRNQYLAAYIGNSSSGCQSADIGRFFNHHRFVLFLSTVRPICCSKQLQLFDWQKCYWNKTNSD